MNSMGLRLNSVLVALAFIAMLLSGCTVPQDDLLRVLHAAGYSKVQVTGYRPFACSEDDQFHTGFTAVGPTGASVTGTVCSGFLKGNTIRLD